MTAFTPNFNLPYPTALDDPCDFAEQWCDFTNAVTGVLDGFEEIADRTNPSTLIAKMELTNAVTLAGPSILSFDAVSVNNAGMVDFDVSRQRIRINRPGRFSAEAHVLFTGSGVANNQFTIRIDGNTMQDKTRAVEVASPIIGMMYTTPFELVSFPFTPVDVWIEVDAATAPTYVVTNASLAVYWFADRSAP